jgi:hypothetical protein
MPRWATQAIIGSTDFSNCRVLLQGSGLFKSVYRGSSVVAASGVPRIQRVNVGVNMNVHYAFNIVYANATDLLAVIAAMQAAETANTPLRVRYTDAVTTFDNISWRDYDVEEWLSFGPESEGIVENAVIRLMAVGTYTP